MIILASNSPRRKELLALTGWDYQVRAALVDESVRPSEPPDAYVRRLAREKAQAALEKIPPSERSQVLVFTGLAVQRPGDGAGLDDAILAEVVVTDVWMRDYSDAEVQAYIASGDPLDKAGGYAIQHAGFRPVQNLQGCYANVMGLPVCHLVKMMAEFGRQPCTAIADACQESLDHPCQVFLQVLKE
jgi:septum formation protein